MEVFNFISSDNAVEIKAVTAADQNRLWTRFVSRVSHDKAQTYCDYAATLPGELKLLLPQGNSLTSIGVDEKSFKELPPVFYETATYNFTIRFRGLASEPQIVHKLQEVSELFTIVDADSERGDYIITAPLNFLNEPGIFNLTFRYTPQGKATRTDSIAFRVVSPKLDTKDDYMHILNEINREYNEIVYQYLTKTVQNLTHGGHSDNDVVWLSIFKQVIDSYIQAVTYIVNRPHLSETKEVHFSRAEKIKRWTPQMAQQYERSRLRQTLDRDYFRHEVTINTSNTAENRFVKFSLERISRRLNRVFNRIRSYNDEITQDELDMLDEYSAKLRKLSNSPLFRGIKAEPLHRESMVLQKRTGYSQVYRYWIMLQKGIELYEGSMQIGVRPIWELYELWCFLKMRQMVAKILGLHFGNIEEISEDPMPMIEPFTENKQEHTVFYYSGDDVVRLHYQHTYNRSSGEVHTATTDNRPDIVLTIHKPNGFELTYLFDAKYRVSDDNEFTKEDKEEINTLRAADYPPSDAINQMHRYRDAIYYGEKQQNVQQHSAKEIIGGYILFPGRGDDVAVRNRYFYKSIETVNIGAFPLLPYHNDPDNEGSLLYEHLAKVLTEQTAYQQIRDSIPQHGLVYTRTVAESNDIVLVGYCKEENIPLVEKNLLYYVPTGVHKGSLKLISGCESAKYLLIYNSSMRKIVELEGTGPIFYPKSELEKKKFKPESEFYLGFDIKSMNPVEIPGINIASIDLSYKGTKGHRSFFTTLKELK